MPKTGKSGSSLSKRNSYKGKSQLRNTKTVSIIKSKNRKPNIKSLIIKYYDLDYLKKNYDKFTAKRIAKAFNKGVKILDKLTKDREPLSEEEKIKLLKIFNVEEDAWGEDIYANDVVMFIPTKFLNGREGNTIADVPLDYYYDLFINWDDRNTKVSLPILSMDPEVYPDEGNVFILNGNHRVKATYLAGFNYVPMKIEIFD